MLIYCSLELEEPAGRLVLVYDGNFSLLSSSLSLRFLAKCRGGISTRIVYEAGQTWARKMEVRLVVQSLFGCATHDFGSPPPNPSSVNIGAKLAQDKYIVRLFSLSAGLSIHPFPFCQQKRRKDSDWSKQTKYISNLLCPISFLLH